MPSLLLPLLPLLLLLLPLLLPFLLLLLLLPRLRHRVTRFRFRLVAARASVASRGKKQCRRGKQGKEVGRQGRSRNHVVCSLRLRLPVHSSAACSSLSAFICFPCCLLAVVFGPPPLPLPPLLPTLSPCTPFAGLAGIRKIALGFAIVFLLRMRSRAAATTRYLFAPKRSAPQATRGTGVGVEGGGR